MVSIDVLKNSYNILVPAQKKELMKRLEEKMLEHAKNLEFEEAAVVRDELEQLKGAE
jgi:excinuclease ABC subunit B